MTRESVGATVTVTLGTRAGEPSATAGGKGRGNREGRGEDEAGWTGALRPVERAGRGRRGTSRRILGSVLAGVVGFGWGGLVLPVTMSPASHRCALCAPDSRLPVRRLSAADLVIEADGIARRNEREVARIDEALRRGEYGPPSSNSAVARARREAKARLGTVYELLYGLAAQPDLIKEADEGALQRLFAEFTEPGLFPSARLERLRLGRGRVCARYDLSKGGRGETVIGGAVFPYVVSDVVVDGQARRVLTLTYRSGAVSHFEALLESHYSFDVERLEWAGAGPSSKRVIYVFSGVDGGWVRRFGLHRPTAFIFWSSPRGEGGAGGESASSGIRVYIPGLRLDLPVLPDVRFDDLRELNLPSPLLHVSYARGVSPRWLGINDHLEFKDWDGTGAMPECVRSRFPDL